MKWIGQHIYDLVARFRGKVYFENDLDITGDITATGDVFTFQSANADDPQVIIRNTTNDNQAARLQFWKNRTDAQADNDRVAELDFMGEDASGNSQQYGKIMVQAVETDHGSETGKIRIQTTEYDGTLTDGLILTGQNADGEIDVTIGAGESSSTTVSGDLQVSGGDISCINSTNSTLSLATAHASNVPRINFQRMATGTTGDDLGAIRFTGDDDGGGVHVYGNILGEIADASAGAEAGKISLQVAEYDGTVTTGLVVDGDTNANGEVDVTIGAGTASGTKIAGNLNVVTELAMGSPAVSAMDDAGRLLVANQSGITGVGTITSGTWQGTAIASDQQKHVMHYQTTGYASSPTNYEIPKQFSANTAPFQHDVDIGSDGLTAQTVQIWMRTQGHVMPRACTLKRWTGWATSNGSDTTYIALFKVTPTRNNNSDVSAVLLEEFSYTALGNAKAEDFDETSFTETAIAAGDIIFTAMKGPGSAQYFNGTFEVEF